MESDDQFKPCTVLIVEDDPRFRVRFAEAVLGAFNMDLLGTATSVTEATHLVEDLVPDVALIDLRLPDGDGLQLIRRIARLGGGPKTLVVTIFDDADTIMQCIKAGASGYLLKDADDNDIVEQIRLVHAGKASIGPSVAQRVLALLRRSEIVSAGEQRERLLLSEQEHAVLKGCARGFNNGEIADALGVSVHTVGEYVRRIFKKLHVHSKTQAVHVASQLGIALD